MSSEPTKRPSRATRVSAEHTGGVDLPQVPLLTREQEQGLFLRYNLLKYKQHNLQQRYRGTTPPESALTEFTNLDAAIEADRNTIIEANLRLIVSVAKKYRTAQYSLQALTQEGVIPII